MQGWQCPKCKRVYSPIIFECDICAWSRFKITTSNDSGPANGSGHD